FGNALNVDPLGGASLVANGVVNDHFGWDRGNSNTVALEYFGRVADNKVEIDASASYSQFATQEAWRLDNPDHYHVPSTQEQDAQGTSLFELLDRDQAVALVPGVKEA